MSISTAIELIGDPADIFNQLNKEQPCNDSEIDKADDERWKRKEPQKPFEPGTN
jgi:hypothetical protein